MTTKELNAQAALALRRAADLVAEGWTQGAMARNELGEDTYPTDPRAVCWCALGAVFGACAPNEDGDVAAHAIRELGARLVRDPANGCDKCVWGAYDAIVHWNDASRGPAAEIARTMREAAQELEAE